MSTKTQIKMAVAGVLISLGTVFQDAKAQTRGNDIRVSKVIQRLKGQSTARIKELNSEIAPLEEAQNTIAQDLGTPILLDSARLDSTYLQGQFNSWYAQARDLNDRFENDEIAKRHYNAERENLHTAEDSTAFYYRELDAVKQQIIRLNGLIARYKNGAPIPSNDLISAIQDLETDLAEPRKEREDEHANIVTLDSVQFNFYAPAIERLQLIANNLDRIEKLENQKLVVANNRNLTDRQARSRNGVLQDEINELEADNTVYRNEFTTFVAQITGVPVNGQKIRDEIGVI